MTFLPIPRLKQHTKRTIKAIVAQFSQPAASLKVIQAVSSSKQKMVTPALARVNFRLATRLMSGTETKMEAVLSTELPMLLYWATRALRPTPRKVFVE